MEDWQEWQLRADQVAADLGAEVSRLEAEYFGDNADANLRGFWPRFRELKERVRVAPAIKLEDKLDLERRLRTLGNRAYKGQEAAYERSGVRKAELLQRIEQVAAAGASEDNPRALRTVRRDLDGVREQFDGDSLLMPPDRQAVWDAWRAANQGIWQRLTDQWASNEAYLRDLLANAREGLERGNPGAARQAVGRFFEQLRTHEARQESVVAMRREAEEIRRSADEAEERKSSEQAASQARENVPAADQWRADVTRNRQTIARLSDDVQTLEARLAATDSLLEHAMVRGTLVDKRQKLNELERTTRALEQRIKQLEEVPLIPTA